MVNMNLTDLVQAAGIKGAESPNLEYKVDSQQFEIDRLQRRVFVLEKTSQIGAAAKDVLTQLFIHGPLFDGDISSKNGRGELVSLGLVERYDGYNFLNKNGVIVSLGIGLERVKMSRQSETSKALDAYRQNNAD